MIPKPKKDELFSLVRESGRKLLEFWPGNAGASAELGAAYEKFDGSPVTRADMAANEILCSGISRIFPGEAIHSEEVAAPADLWSSSRVWVIDPLDGTSVFLQGSDEFSVLVALTVRGYPEFGLMYFPARDLLLHAERGFGAFCNQHRLHVSSSNRVRPQGIYGRLIEIDPPSLQLPLHLDSGDAFLRLASGELDGVVFRLTKLREWDLAAPAVIIEEAGGRISDARGGRVSFRSGELPEIFVGSNLACHAEILKSLRG